MAARDQPRIEPPAAPVEFTRAVTQMRAARFRPELFVEEMPAPQRIAPFASALSADVTVDGEEVGSGRVVLLHDPAGNDAWDGTFRCVAYARAEIDPELVSDPLLAGVGWSWLTEALDAHGADYAAPSGTVTCVSSESFGGMADEPPTRPARDPGLLVAGRRPHPPRRGLGRAAVHGGRACPPCPRASRRCPPVADNVARADGGD